MQNAMYFFILMLALAGCHTPHSMPITNNLSVSVSENDRWDLFALLEQSFEEEIESIILDTVHYGTPVVSICFPPKSLDVHTFEYGTCFVWHEDWQGGWGRVLDVKIRKGKWYSDLCVHKTVKWKFDLEGDSFLIPAVQNATYDEIHDVLKMIEDGRYLIAEPELYKIQVDIDWSSVSWIEKSDKDGYISYMIHTGEGRFTSEFMLRDGKLYLIGRGVRIG